MTAEYKKRAKGGWNGDKKQSNRDERTHASKLEKAAENELSASVEDLMIRSEWNEEINKRLSGYEEPPHTKAPKIKKANDKTIQRLLSSLRYVHKFAANHAGGDVESLRYNHDKHEWWNGVRQEYYQRYKKQVPEVQKYLERTDIPSKLRRQILEVLGLFGL